MQRGILSLTHSEQTLLRTVLLDTPLAGSLLATKLHTDLEDSSTAGAEDALELSRDEAESLLDMLPIPSDQEPFEVTAVRQKIQTFILNL